MLQAGKHRFTRLVRVFTRSCVVAVIFVAMHATGSGITTFTTTPPPFTPDHPGCQEENWILARAAFVVL